MTDLQTQSRCHEMNTVEYRNPTNKSESIYITELGQYAVSAYHEARKTMKATGSVEALRAKVLSYQGADENAEKLTALAMMGIAAGEASDLYNPITDQKAEWALVQAIHAMEREEWGMHPATKPAAAQPNTCRHGKPFSADCPACDAE